MRSEPAFPGESAMFRGYVKCGCRIYDEGCFHDDNCANRQARAVSPSSAAPESSKGVVSGEGQNTELPIELLGRIERLCAEGDELLDQGRCGDALVRYQLAWELLPE